MYNTLNIFSKYHLLDWKPGIVVCRPVSYSRLNTFVKASFVPYVPRENTHTNEAFSIIQKIKKRGSPISKFNQTVPGNRQACIDAVCTYMYI